MRRVFFYAIGIALSTVTVHQIHAQSCTSPPLSEPVFAAAGGDTAGVAIGDLDGNGSNDLVVARPSANAVALLFNDGTGTFGPPQLLAAGTTPVAVAVADLNHDGFNDIAVANSGSNSISIFLGVGGGAFGPATTITTATGPRAIVTGDFNGDGLRDLAVANYGANNIQLFYGTGTGSFGSAVTQTATDVPLVQPVAMAVGNLDGDNRDDLIVVGSGSTRAVIFYERTIVSHLAFPVGTAPISVGLGEFVSDMNHTVDAVVANEGSNTLTVQELWVANVAPKDPFGPLVSITIALPGPPSSVAVADFNGDHRPDVVVVSRSMNELWLLYNAGPINASGLDPGQDVSFSAPIRYQLSTGSVAVTAGDVNGDGYPDAVTSMPSVNGLSILRGANWPVVSKPYFVVIPATSGSMSVSVGSVPACAGYPSTRSGHERCALRNLFKSYTDTVEFGLATFAMRQASCATSCFTSCTYSAFPQETVTTGCGPRTGDATTRAGAFIRVPVRQDNFWTSPAPPDNRGQLNAWVDNACGDNQELFASGSTPLNGALRDMKRYFGSAWSAPDGSVSYSTPLSPNDRSCRSVNVILITASDDTCDAQADVVAAAADLFTNGVTVGGKTFKIRTYVINLGATQANADAIAAAGGTNAAYFVATEAQIAMALSNIVSNTISSATPLETCNGADENCNGCVNEGWLHAPIASNSGPACAGSDVQIHATTFPGATYSWSGPNSYSSTTQSPTISAVPVSANGAYTFTATVNGCISVSATTQIVVNAPPDASIASPAQVTASWSSFASVADAGIGSVYTWSVSGGTFTGQGTRSIRFTAGPSGTVSVSVIVQNAAGCSAYGNRSVAIVSGPVFTDDPLSTGVTLIKAIHLFEVRDAVNLVRAKVGLAAATWTDTASPGLIVKASHIIELRNALTPALVAMLRTAVYTDPDLASGGPVKAVHVQEIRDYTK